MIGDLKGDLVNNAYKMGRISGLTKIPGPRENETGLAELENMANEFLSDGIMTGYKFEEEPDTASEHGLPRKYWTAYESTLACRLLHYYGKEPLQGLRLKQGSTYSKLLANALPIEQSQYPSRQPLGKGNNRWGYYQRYYPETVENNPDYPLHLMCYGDVNNYEESFDAYLVDPEEIASYVLTNSDGLTITNESLSSPVLSYTVQPNGTGLMYVKIVATTDTSRVTTRIIQFDVTKVTI